VEEGRGEDMTHPTVYAYIPNSEPETKKAMLREIGVDELDELYADIPESVRLKGRLELPAPKSEYEVRRAVAGVLAKNRTRGEMPCFLGAGCWPHIVPAVCDEINGRAEFVTNYHGPVQVILGINQAVFEYQSMMGELLAMDAVVSSMYDWATVCGEAVRMARRLTGRDEVLVPRTMSPDRLSVMRNYAGDVARIRPVAYEPDTGQLDLEDLQRKISARTAGVYVENPSYLGFIEAHAEAIAEVAHDHGALSIVGVEPSSLGVLTPPGEYSADIVIGEGQPLGMHPTYGGALLGIMAFRDDPAFIAEAPRRTNTITTTDREGVWGFTPVHIERDSYHARERGVSFTGTASQLWSITAAVYMALMGPHGFRELGELIMHNAHYAMQRIAEIRGVRAPMFRSTHFEEFTVNFDGTGETVQRVNRALLARGVHGGKDLTGEFPELGSSALFCVTETHTQGDIDALADALEAIAEGATT
jgi:glycine dehydrogenase subunit 1